MILLVEDDVDVREMLEFTLKSRGYAVELATNGRAALDALGQHRPCLMILDLRMPVMDGWQVIAQMKERSLDVPVCVITALEERIPNQAVASLCKPFVARDLLAVAARYCTHVTPAPARAGSA